MNNNNLAKMIGIAMLIFVLVLVASTSSFVFDPVHRGVKVTLGKVSPRFMPEGFGFKSPFVTRIEQVSVRQQTRPSKAECYSSDLQQVDIEIVILYRVPEQSVVSVYQDYYGEPFESLIS